jgi:hypothetical protein
MELRDRCESFTLGGLMQEFSEHIERRLVELEAMVGLRPEQMSEREHLRLAYLHIKEEMKYLER